MRFLSENFQFLEMKFSMYLNRRVFAMVNESSMFQLMKLYCNSYHNIFTAPDIISYHDEDGKTTASENVPSDMCAQRRFRSACAFAQTDPNLRLMHFG